MNENDVFMMIYVYKYCLLVLLWSDINENDVFMMIYVYKYCLLVLLWSDINGQLIEYPPN